MPYVFDDDGTGRNLEGFGLYQSGWESLLRSAMSKARPGLEIANVLNAKASPSPSDPGAWLHSLPSMTCEAVARSIGRGTEVDALCAAFDRVLAPDAAIGSGWTVAKSLITSNLAEDEATKWSEATCQQRPDADGGGEICTAADGAKQVRCYNAATGEWEAHLAGTRCPTSGALRAPLTVVKTQPKFTPTVPGAGGELATVQGRIVDDAGTSVSGATVVIGPPAGPVVMATSYKSAVTGATGAFAIQQKPGTYELRIKRSGFPDVVVPGLVVPGAGTLNLSTLTVPATIGCPAGQVLDPITGACIPAPAGCPTGQVLDPITGSCVEPKSGAARPWYKSPWPWVALGGVVLAGGGYLLWRARRQKR